LETAIIAAKSRALNYSEYGGTEIAYIRRVEQGHPVSLSKNGNRGAEIMTNIGGVVKAFWDGSAMFRHRKRLWTALFGVMAVLTVCSTTNAGLIITLSEAGVAGPTVVASTPGNSAFFAGSFGDYTFSIDTAVTNSPGVSSLATLNVSSSETRGAPLPGSSGILTINVEATGFTTPAATTPTFFLQSIGSNSSSSTATMTFQSFLDGSSAPLQGPLAQGMSDTLVVGFPGPLSAFPFSISDTTTIHVSPGLEGSTSGSTEVGSTTKFQPPPVPEPNSSVVWIAAAVCLIGATRMRSRWRLA
jgi:hypothetical protein